MCATRRLVIVAIGGATCSGKTTLAKALSKVIPGSKCLFQDDFAPPADKVPIHPVHGVQDWDDPDGAIEWDRQRSTLAYLRQHHEFPSRHYSHDHLNAQIPVAINSQLLSQWQTKFQQLVEPKDDNQLPIDFIIADGFLMLVDQESVKQFDVKLFVREDYNTLKQRRDERAGYHTAVQSDMSEGALWKDPPNYWDNIVWPAYLKAHRPLFVNGDVEHGSFDSNVIADVELLEAKDMSMDELLDKVAKRVFEFASGSTQA
ncbi:ribosylnicotinamide kinase [Microbotryomycetes sp. JL221]|nr:ribosylnicotinamide kinase [Microbotryomycetes sp. JL221]